MSQKSEGLQPNLSSPKLQPSFPYCETTPWADDAWGSLDNLMLHSREVLGTQVKSLKKNKEGDIRLYGLQTISVEAIVHFTYLGV